MSDVNSNNLFFFIDRKMPKALLPILNKPKTEIKKNKKVLIEKNIQVININDFLLLINLSILTR